eukprot:6173320-Pleurochrysis_carterae.AAC.3
MGVCTPRTCLHTHDSAETRQQLSACATAPRLPRRHAPHSFVQDASAPALLRSRKHGRVHPHARSTAFRRLARTHQSMMTRTRANTCTHKGECASPPTFLSASFSLSFPLLQRFC